MAILSLLADPAHYVPCSTENMHTDIEYRDHWFGHFERHFRTVLQLALDTYGPGAREKTEACYADLIGRLHAILANPGQLPRLDLLVLDALRQDILVAHGLPDPFEKVKTQENQACLPLYPQVVAELDSHADAREALLLATEGVFAGNIFDLGAHASTELFANGTPPDFLTVRNSLDGKRPWLIDHFEAMADRLLSHRHRQAIFFCDNAGPDLILGVLPFCRLLARAGTRVLIAANELPALNDITVGELKALLPVLCAADPVLGGLVRDGMIRAVSSGNRIPLIDLRDISDEVNAYARDTDLLILEGMGRAVETNLYASFTVDSLKLAMIKDKMVARRRGGKNFDTICKFDPPSTACRKE